MIGMTVERHMPWPQRPALILTAVAMLLASLSLQVENWIGTLLKNGAIVLSVAAALAMYYAWGQTPSRRN